MDTVWVKEREVYIDGGQHSNPPSPCHGIMRIHLVCIVIVSM